MYIENDDTLVVKSGIEFYEKERSGLKPNIWRYFDLDDEITYADMDCVKYIKIINLNNQICSFKRAKTDISYYHTGVATVIIISWEHSNGIN